MKSAEEMAREMVSEPWWDNHGERHEGRVRDEEGCAVESNADLIALLTRTLGRARAEAYAAGKADGAQEERERIRALAREAEDAADFTREMIDGS